MELKQQQLKDEEQGEEGHWFLDKRVRITYLALISSLRLNGLISWLPHNVRASTFVECLFVA